MNHSLTNPLSQEFHVYRSHNLTRFAHRKELCPRDPRPLICGWVLQNCWNTAIFTNILYIIYSLSISGLIIWLHFHQFCYQPLPHLSVDDSVYHKTIETGNSWLFNYTYCVYCILILLSPVVFFAFQIKDEKQSAQSLLWWC